MPNMVELMKKAAIEAMNASMPAGIFYGTVESTSPLKITIDQNEPLEANQLLLTSLVRDFTVSMTVNGSTSTYQVHLSLKKGEKVILQRIQGGQKYIVSDRVR